MNNSFSIPPQTIHLWRIVLPDLFAQIPELTTLLSPDEFERAMRFKFEIHRQRFIVARGILRRVLNLYTGVSAQDIKFSYGKRGKPFLEDQNLQFNVTHSGDLAVFAFTSDCVVGVDIEKIETEFKDGVAKRFFSAEENLFLEQLSEDKKVTAFYHIWAKKEALIKALGEGLYAPLDTFSVGMRDEIETVNVMQDTKLVPYFIQSFFVHEDYQAAYATDKILTSVKYCEWS